MKEIRPRGRQKIPGLQRINITLTNEERKYLESLGNGQGLVAGIRRAIERSRNMGKIK